MAPCKYGDPTCPCQDGDPCHYEGERPMSVAPNYVRNVIAERDRLRALVEKMAIVLLPMAKGYANQHPVGQNAEMVAEIEVALAKAREAG